MSKVYVGNLSWNTTDDSLKHAFSSYGTIDSTIVQRDADTGRSRGFGFVTFNSSDDANNAIAGMNEQELDGRRIRVNMANTRSSGGGYSVNTESSGGYSGGGYSGYNNTGGGYGY